MSSGTFNSANTLLCDTLALSQSCWFGVGAAKTTPHLGVSWYFSKVSQSGAHRPSSSALRICGVQARPGIKIFIDLDVDMKGDLTGTLEEGVRIVQNHLPPHPEDVFGKGVCGEFGGGPNIFLGAEMSTKI